MIIEHLLALFLIVIGPIWDYFEVRKLKASTDPRRKVKFYWLVMGLTWSLSAIACVAVGWPEIFKIYADPGEIAWIPSGSGAHSFIVGVLLTFVVGLMVPVILMRRIPRYAAAVEKALAGLNFMLPTTTDERWWWVLICATAGIGEEILYRGFLIQYFQRGPLHAKLLLAVALACVIFGIAHMYQGLKGVLGTTFLGIMFAAIFVMTGNLLVPMIVHFLIDLRILLLLPADKKLSVESA